MLHGALRFSDHPARAHPAHRHVEGRGAPGRRRRRHRRGRPGRAHAGVAHEGLAAARRRRRGDRLRRRRDRRGRRRDAPCRPRGGCARRGRVRGARAGHRPVRSRAPPCSPPRSSSAATPTPPSFDAAHVVTERFRTQFIEHAFLEPESALAVPEGDAGMHVYSQGQGIWDDRRQIASFLGVPEERGPGHARPHRRRLRREGGPERPVPRGAARLARRAACARHAQPEGEPALPRQAARDVARVHRRLRRGGTAARRARPDRRRHRRLRERRRQGARARGRPRLRRLPGAERRRRGEGRLHEQPAVRGDARLRRQPVQLRHRGRPRPARRAGRDRRLGDPLAQRARAPATASAPASCSGPASA